MRRCEPIICGKRSNDFSSIPSPNLLLLSGIRRSFAHRAEDWIEQLSPNRSHSRMTCAISRCREFAGSRKRDSWRIVILGLLGSLHSYSTSATDWPQYRGPERNGISTEATWFPNWPEGATPKVGWRAQVGKGHAAVSVAGERAVTTGWDGERDHVFCFEVATGKVVWQESYPCKSILQWPGPRATPTIHQGRVYTLGQHGQLRAWELATGKLVWQRDLPEKYNPDVDYGFCWSPLIVSADAGQKGEDLLILNAGSHGRHHQDSRRTREPRQSQRAPRQDERYRRVPNRRRLTGSE